MKRRIIKQADQAYTLTLPIEWVRKHKLGAKSEVDVTTSEKSLIISTNASVEGKKITVNIKDWRGRTIRNYILALYAKGVDEIVINSDKDISSELTVALNNLIGFAMVSQENNKYVIKDINAGAYQHLDEIFKRVYQMIILFYESAIKDVFGEEQEKLESLRARDNEVNKFCLYLQRAVNKSSYPDIIESRVIFTYSYNLEKIGDEIERFWRTNVKYKPKKPSGLKNLAELSKEGLAKSFDVFYQFSPKLTEQLYAIREDVRDKSLKLQFKDPNAVRIMRHIVKIVEDAADLNHLNIIMKS